MEKYIYSVPFVEFFFLFKKKKRGLFGETLTPTAGEVLVTLGQTEAPHSWPTLHRKEAEPVAKPYPGSERAQGSLEGTPCTLASCLEHPGTWRGSLLPGASGPCTLWGPAQRVGVWRGWSGSLQSCGEGTASSVVSQVALRPKHGCGFRTLEIVPHPHLNLNPSPAKSHSFSVSTALLDSQPF